MLIDWECEKENLVRLTQAGKTFAEIAEKYDVSRQRVCQVFQTLKITSKGYKLKLERLARDRNRIKAEIKQLTTFEKIIRVKFNGKKANAKARGVLFTILLEDMEFPTHCPVLGLELDYYSKKMKDNSPSFDRLNPSFGYIKGNVVIISQRANRIKNDGTLEEFKLLCSYLENQKYEYRTTIT